MSVREIIDGHQVDIVEGENAWIGLATKKKYTNLTSCTAVRTSLAAEEPFPSESVSEDSHTWVRYAAHPGKFVFIRDIKGGYRICSNVASRSRSNNANFYKKCSRSILPDLKKRSRSQEGTALWAVSTKTISQRHSMCVWRSACSTENP